MGAHGYGKDAANVRAAFAFQTLGLRRLLSSYLEGNARSARMQRAVGFVECGRLPDDVWKDGAYRAQVFTVLTREGWEASQRAIGGAPGAVPSFSGRP